ncbi:MAG: phosphatidylserine decarboxylase [Thermoplasmata archaeon]
MIAKGGRGLVGISAGASLIVLPIQLYAALGLAVLTGFLTFVFRDPRRTIGMGVVAPADGTVREVAPERGLISVYLGLRNVHVTRAPIEGVVEKAIRTHGRHAPAFSKKTEHNERIEISLKTAIGGVSVTQMAGTIARRIVPYISDGQHVGKGDKLGLIRFGSRVDVCLPPSAVHILVKKGQRVRAGVTTIAEVRDGSME